MHFTSFGFIRDPLDSFSFFVCRIECLPPRRGYKTAPLEPGPTSPFKILNCKTPFHVGAWPLTNKLRGHTHVPHLLISLSRILPGWAVFYDEWVDQGGVEWVDQGGVGPSARTKKMGGVGSRGVGGTVRSALRVARRRQTSALDCATYQNRRKQNKQTEKSRAHSCCANGIFSLPGKCISEGTQLSGALYSAPANTCTSRFTSHTAVMSAYQAHHPAPPPPPEHAPAPGRPP